MLALILTLIPGVVALVVVGLDKIAAKTKNTIDDKIVAYIKANEGALVEIIDALAAKKAPALGPAAAPAPRPAVIDHRVAPSPAVMVESKPEAK